MNTFRPDEALLDIFRRGGPVLLCIGVAILVYAARARFTRALGVSLFLLIGAQTWLLYTHLLGRNLRWLVLALVCGRGVLLALRTPRPPWDTGRGRPLAAGLGVVALASALWAESWTYTLYTATSFVLSLVAAFVVLWRLYDEEDVVAVACRGALWCALLIFGSGFLFRVYAESVGDVEILYRMHTGGRFSGIFFNPNMNGILAMILIPPLVAAPRSWLGSGAALRWPVIAVACAALYLSGSRSSLIGTVVSLTILFLYRFGAGALFTVGLGTVGIYVLATSGQIEDIDASAVGHFARTKHLHTLSGRLELWEEGLDAVRGHELLGMGWGSSRLLHGADPDEAVERGNVVGASNLHSTHVQVLVDVGFVGASLLWLLCLQVLWTGWRLLLMPRTERSVAAVMVLACFVATFADTFVHGSVLSTGSPSAIIFWASAAILLREADRARAGVAEYHAAPHGSGFQPSPA